ncbi:hypothetical protein [Halorhodospira sp. 9622]|uniref:hypothetical protein n=1 Tax=Halorhodospira sp. 9622 TaxID=2899136 RepID=UPI001EE94793|nr:hypothetical protein [Halorhodospira sp. 9622]MCG5539273.1 hypothetical protein [Halorhodospira sp. 9622]
MSRAKSERFSAAKLHGPTFWDGRFTAPFAKEFATSLAKVFAAKPKLFATPFARRAKSFALAWCVLAGSVFERHVCMASVSSISDLLRRLLMASRSIEKTRMFYDQL